MLILGLDLGGTKTSVCLGDENGSIHASRRFPTNSGEGPGPWLERTALTAEALLREAGLGWSDVSAIGLSVPGPMSVARGVLIAPPNLPGWIEVPIRDLCAQRCPRPLFVQNDANAAALAEFRFGACRGVADLVYLTLSTGVGAGVLSGGRLVQGATDLGGEIGHHVLDRSGPPCPCGQRGCFEIYCGGLSVANRIRARIAAGAATTMLALAGGNAEAIDFRILVEAAKAGDPLAREFWDEFTERLAQALGTAIMLYNPKAIILGTIAVGTGDFLLDPVRRALPRYAWPCSRAACERIEASALGSKVGDLAALALVLDRLDRKGDRP